MVLKADINACEIIDWQTNAGEYNARILQVELCEEMNKCAMSFVTFETEEGTLYESLIVEGKAEIPLFEKAQFIKIGAYSADVEGGVCKKRYSPKPCYDYVNPGSYSGNSEESPLPTPSAMAELTKKVEGAVSKDDLETEVFVGENYAEDKVYTANAINGVLMAFNEILANFDERLGAIEEDYTQALSLIGGAE
jgi:hypothetical protein